MSDNNQFKLGGIESPEDVRDIPLGAVQARLDQAQRPLVFLPNYSELEIYYQNGKPECGGCAGARFMATLQYVASGIVPRFTPRCLYAVCKAIDDFRFAEGTTLRAIMQALRNYGVPEAEYMTHDVHLPYEEFIDLSKANPGWVENAARFRIRNFAFVKDRTFDGLCDAIYQNKAVIALMKPWHADYPDGHFIVLDGYDETVPHIRYANSFGRKWGEDGYGTLSPVDCRRILEAATAVAIPDKVLPILKQQVPILQHLVSLYLKLLASKGRPVIISN